MGLRQVYFIVGKLSKSESHSSLKPTRKLTKQALNLKSNCHGQVKPT